jgi:hypothetical protein
MFLWKCCRVPKKYVAGDGAPAYNGIASSKVIEMTTFTGALADVHSYIDLIALAAAFLALVPVYRDYGRRFFVIALVILCLCVTALSVLINRLHENELGRVQNHIVQSLRGGPKTFDELAQSLGYREVGQMSEALDAMLDARESEIQHDDVKLQNCDGNVIAVVRKYYINAVDDKKR